MRAHLTEIAVRALKPVPGKQVKVWDTTTPGFGVRVNGNSKSWIVMFGKTRQLKVLGRYPDMPLAEARRQAKLILVGDQNEQAPSITFGEAASIYLSTHCEQHQRPKTRYETKRILNRHYLPRLGTRKLADIQPRDVTAMIDLLLEAPSEALHAFRVGRQLFNWAVGRHLVSRSPMEGIPLPVKEVRRARTLTDGELTAVWKAADDSFGAMIRLLILTGARKNEIGKAQWGWIDGDTLTIPGEHTKSGRTHYVPLCRLAQEVIEAIPRRGLFLFPGKWDDKHIHDGSWGKLKRALDEKAGVFDWTIHDLRRTFATNLAALGTPIHVTERLLNHVAGATTGGLVGIYQRHAFWEEQVAAINKWQDKMLRLLSR